MRWLSRRLRRSGRPTQANQASRWLSSTAWHELLEPRILLSGADPSVMINGANPADPFIGESVSLDLTFENTDGADSGFTPFVDLILDTNGADGAAGADTPDGLTFGRATFLGGPLPATEVVFDGAGQAVHPLLGTTLAGTPGDTLVVIQFPFGSVAPTQRFDFSVELDVSNLADLGVPLDVQARGGFLLGCDALDNPGVDPPVVPAFGGAGTAATSVSPALLEVTKLSLAPETETATGPNFPRQFQITLDLADGQTLDDLRFEDFLGPDLAFLAIDSIAGSAGALGTVTDLPSVGAPALAPDNDIGIDFGSVTGTDQPDDIVITFSYFVAGIMAGGGDVLDPLSGDDDVTTNPVAGSPDLVRGDWTPVDLRDPMSAASGTDSALIEQKSIAVQKAVANLSDATNSSGDVLEYTLNVQVSDFFTLGDIAITDFLGDAQSFDATFTPTFSVSERGAVVAGLFDQAGELSTLPDDANGIEEISFDLSLALANEGPDGLLVGGLVNAGAFGGTTATIVFHALIDPSFVDPPGGTNGSVSQGDLLGNDSRIDGTIRDNVTPATVTDTESDGTGTRIEVPRGTLTKSIYAVNGVVGAVPTGIQAGQTITYRLRYDLPLSEFEDFAIQDFLPQPILLATELAGFDSTPPFPDPDPPLAGTSTFGPDDTFFATLGIVPGVVADSVTNSVTFDLGTADAVTDTPSVLDILFTVTVQDQPFADGLNLTNQARADESSTNNGSQSEADIVQVTLAAPELAIRKGVVSVGSNTTPLPPGPTFDAAIAPGGVSFQAPGIAAGAAFSGTISSANLGSTLDANLSGVDAGDLVKFVIAVENVGGDDAFDVLIRDTIPTGFLAPGVGLGGINLKVTDGSGAAFAGFTQTVTATSLQVELVDGVTGSLQDQAEGAATPGSNLLIITYDLLVPDTASAGDVEINTATVDAFAAEEGGLDRSLDPMDTARVTMSLPRSDKSLLSPGDPTSEPSTAAAQGNAGLQDLTIGEEVTFRIVATVPEGTQDTFVVEDLLPVAPGLLEVVSSQVIRIGGQLTVAAGGLGLGDPGAASDARLGDGVLDRVLFDFTATGALFNLPDGSIDGGDEIEVEVVARVVDQLPENVGITLIANTANILFDNGTVTDTQSVEIVEPRLDITKSSPTTSGDAGDLVSYTIRVDHVGSSADAFDLSIIDPGVAGVTIQGGTLVVTTPGAVTINSGNLTGDPIDIDVSELLLGDSVVIRFDARLDPDVAPGQALTNTAGVDWTSLPGADPQERTRSDSDPHTVTVSSGGLDKQVVATSRADSGTGSGNDFHDAGIEDLAIGETVTFRLAYTMPEGEDQIVITDQLPTGAPPGSSGVLELLTAQVISIGASITPAGATTITISDSNADLLDDRAVFDFGTLTNTADGVVTAGDVITVEVTALLVNDPGENLDGDLLTNTGTVSFSNGSVSGSASVNVVEPELAIAKSVAPAMGDAGDSVTYQIVVSHGVDSALNAYDLSVTDPGVAGVTISGTLFTAVSSDPGAVVTVNSGMLAGETLDVDVSQLALGETVTITFEATLDADVAPGAMLTNTARADFDNTPGVDANERAAFGEDDATVTVDSPGFDKRIIATSLPQTGTGEFDPGITDVAIGETVTFELVFVMPEGETSLRITDSLPVLGAVDLLELQSSLVTLGANVSATQPGAAAGTDTNGDGRNDELLFDFGTITNTPDGVRDADDEIRVQVTAVVLDVAPNVADFDLVNSATADFGGTLLTDTESVEIVEPLLVVDKTSGETDLAPGDLTTYTVVVSHDPASSQTAFDLTIADLLDPLLELQAGTLSVVSTDPSSVVTVNSGSLAGDTIDVSISELAQGGTVTLQYTARVVAGAPLATTIPNSVLLSFDGSPGADPNQRGETDSDMASVRTEPAIVKTITATGLGDTALQVGETITFEVLLTVGEGDTILSLTDQLPPVLSVVSSQVLSIGANVSGSALAVGAAGTAADVSPADGLADQVVFAFGTVSNVFDGVVDADDQIRVQVVARVEDVAANADGNTDVNVATVSFQDPMAAGPKTSSDSATSTIVEPQLVIDKTSSASTGDAGDVLTFTLTIQHDPASTGDGFDVLIEDLIADPDLALVPGATTQILMGPVGTTIVTGDMAGDAVVRVGAPTLALGEVIVVQYDAMVLVGAAPGSQVTNTASLAFDSFPGLGGRPGSDASQATFDVDGPTIDKFVSGSSDSRSRGSQLFPGETVSFDIVVSIPEGTSATLVVTDLLPAGFVPGTLSLLGSEVLSIGANLSGSALSAGEAGTPADTNMDGFPDAVVFDFTSGGPVVNTPDGIETAADQIRVRVTAVASGPGTGIGDVLVNEAVFDFGLGVVRASADTTIVPFPPPPPMDAAPTVFDLYAYTGFDDFREDTVPDARSFRMEPLRTPLEPILSLDPIYSGTAEPGATVEVAIFDGFGVEIGSRSLVVDAGGNWLAMFPSATLFENRDEVSLLEQTSLFRRPGDAFRVADLFGAPRGSERSSTGAILERVPHTIQVEQTRPSYHATAEAGQNQRTYLTPAVNDTAFVRRPITPASVFEDRASFAAEHLDHGTREPLSGTWNKFVEEFLAQPGHPAGR